MDLPPELLLHTDRIKATSMLQFPEKLCFECGLVLWEEGVISRCVLNVKKCMLCNHKYCPPHFMFHIQECILHLCTFKRRLNQYIYYGHFIPF